MPLGYVDCSRDYAAEKPTLLVSAQIDSRYGEYLTRRGEREIAGTFDNSACNAVALYLMLEGRLPRQVLVAFTGDEERGGAGAGQVIQILQRGKYKGESHLSTNGSWLLPSTLQRNHSVARLLPSRITLSSGGRMMFCSGLHTGVN